MQTFRNGGGLVPLTGGGGGVQSRRPYGMPSMVNGMLANAQVLWEDFTVSTVALPGFASGLTATPDTLANLAPFGNASWLGTEIVGTTGQLGLNQSSAASLTNGYVQMISGATSGNCMALDHGGLSNSVGTCWLRNSTTTSNLWQVRWMHNGSVTGGAQSGRYGFGWVATTTAIGTDWITDPDTTLNNSQSIVIHRDGAAAYSGDSRGDIVLRVYSTTTATSLTLVTAAQQTTDGASTWYKVEVLLDGTNVYAWVNNVLIGSVACTTWGVVQQRFSAQVMATSAAARQLNIDSIYAENSNTAAR